MNHQKGRTKPGKPKGPLTSASLLIRVRDPADGESWETFANLYGPIIQAFCRKKGFQQSDIDDICQNVLCTVVQSIRSFEYDPDKGRFRSWLATVTSNKLKDFLRQKNGKCTVFLIDAVEGFVGTPCENPEWSNLFAQRVFQVACERVRPTFAEETWACFEATWLKHEEPAKVAERLEIQVHSVYVNKSRVLKRLEAEFVHLSDDYPVIEPA